MAALLCCKGITVVEAEIVQATKPKIFGLLQKNLLISVLNPVSAASSVILVSLTSYVLCSVHCMITYIVIIFSQEPCRHCHLYSSAADNETPELSNSSRATQPVSDKAWGCTQVSLASELMLFSLPCAAYVEASGNHLLKISSALWLWIKINS